MKVLIAIIFCFSMYCCNGRTMNNCPPEGNKLKPCDSEKAKAVIVKSFGITEEIESLETNWIRKFFQ